MFSCAFFHNGVVGRREGGGILCLMCFLFSVMAPLLRVIQRGKRLGLCCMVSGIGLMEVDGEWWAGWMLTHCGKPALLTDRQCTWSCPSLGHYVIFCTFRRLRPIYNWREGAGLIFLMHALRWHSSVSTTAGFWRFYSTRRKGFPANAREVRSTGALGMCMRL